MINQTMLFISEGYIKERSAVMANVETKFITPQIFEAQDILIQKVLGSCLYEEFTDEFTAYQAAKRADAASGGTGVTIGTYVSDDNQELMDYVQPTLLYGTLFNSMYSFFGKITNKGVVVQNSEFSTTISRQDFQDIRQDYMDKYEFYAQRTTKFIEGAIRIDNTRFTAYTDCNCTEVEDVIRPSKDNFNGGIYLK